MGSKFPNPYLYEFGRILKIVLFQEERNDISLPKRLKQFPTQNLSILLLTKLSKMFTLPEKIQMSKYIMWHKRKIEHATFLRYGQQAYGKVIGIYIISRD